MCTSVSLTSLSVHNVCAWCPRSLEEGIRSLGTGVTEGWGQKLSQFSHSTGEEAGPLLFTPATQFSALRLFRVGQENLISWY